eukprot:746638-Hanusia_phi.AAC.1
MNHHPVLIQITTNPTVTSTPMSQPPSTPTSFLGSILRKELHGGQLRYPPSESPSRRYSVTESRAAGPGPGSLRPGDQPGGPACL